MFYYNVIHHFNKANTANMVSLSGKQQLSFKSSWQLLQFSRPRKSISNSLKAKSASILFNDQFKEMFRICFYQNV